jgi:hypothetical protein
VFDIACDQGGLVDNAGGGHEEAMQIQMMAFDRPAIISTPGRGGNFPDSGKV